MASGHGGARPGAGRKSSAQIAQLRSLIAAIVTDQDWITIMHGIVDDARSGNLRSVAFLLALRYGVSTHTLVTTEHAAPEPPPAEPRPARPSPQTAPAAPPARPATRRPGK